MAGYEWKQDKGLIIQPDLENEAPPLHPSAMLDRPHINTSFHSQISCVLKVEEKKDLYIACADRWVPDRMDLEYETYKKYWELDFSTDEKEREKARKLNLDMAAIDDSIRNTSISDYVWLPLCFEGPHIIYCEKSGKYVCWIKLSGSEAAFVILEAECLLGPYTLVDEFYRPDGLEVGDFDLVCDGKAGKAYLYFEANHDSIVACSFPGIIGRRKER